MRRTSRLLLGAAAISAASLVLPVVQWKLAKRGPGLPQLDPFEHDGHLSGTGPPLRMVWLGDSLAYGAGATSVGAAVPRVVAEAVGGPLDLHVLAVNGSKVRDVLTTQLAQVAPLRPDVVLISAGTNDSLYRVPWRRVRDDYDRVLAGLPADALVLVLSPLDMGAVMGLLQPLRVAIGWYGRVISSEIQGAAERAGVVFVDIARKVGPAIRREPGVLLARDGFHPNDAGYRAIADVVIAELRPALERRRAHGEVVHGDR